VTEVGIPHKRYSHDCESQAANWIMFALQKFPKIIMRKLMTVQFRSVSRWIAHLVSLHAG
jgi:hypothetical protein